jgi:hypothetical protein
MKSNFRVLLSSLVLFTIVACGGGGSTLSRDDNGGGSNTAISVQVAVTNLDGSAKSNLNLDNGLLVTATVLDSSGKPITNRLVTFTISPDNVAVFDVSSGTGETGSTGVATIGLRVGDISGAGEITASLSSGESGSSTFVSDGLSQTGEQPEFLDLFANSTQLASSGSDQVELIAVVKNDQNILMEGVKVTFSSDAASALQLVDNGLTGSDGIARAILTTPNNQANRTIKVTATSGTISPIESELDIQVVGTEISIGSPSSVILNAPTELVIKVSDSDSNGIANKTVTLTTQLGQLSQSSGTTDSEGLLRVDYTASVSGNDVITAQALNAFGTINLTIQEDQFEFTTVPDTEVALGQNATLAVTWKKEGLAYSGGTVSFVSSRGDVSQANTTTNAQGQASVNVLADNAGFASVSAIGVDSDGNEVSARVQIEFIATIADRIVADATPDSIGPSGQTSTITAVVRDAAGNLVKNKLINFRVEDFSNGGISPNQSRTDRSGIASTVYTSNSVSSVDSVRVYATVDDKPSVTDFTTLTVGDRAFDISIGTGRLISSPTDSSYSKEFSIFVTDPDSNPVSNATLTFSAPPVKFNQGGVFRKGSWDYDTVLGTWYTVDVTSCPNEDINGNGVLDAGEDTNGDGFLTPGNVVSVTSQASTDENGQALIEVNYAKQFGAWVDIQLKVSGQSGGTESAESQKYSLSVASEDLTDEASPPPSSPYGVGPNCTDTN